MEDSICTTTENSKIWRNSRIKTLLIADIVWEADSETLKMLPTEVWVPNESIHIAAKHLSEKYGFSIKSYAVPFG